MQQEASSSSSFPSATLLRSQCESGLHEILEASEGITKQLQVLEEKETNWHKLQQQMQQHAAQAKQQIHFNIGGKLFTTSKETLLKQEEGTFFHMMVTSGEWEPDTNGKCGKGEAND